MKQIQTTGLLVLLCLLYSSAFAGNFLNEGFSKQKTEINATASQFANKNFEQNTDSIAPIKYFERGFRSFIESGFNVDDEGNYKWPKLNLIQTFQFKPGLMLGIGVGLQNNHIYRDHYLFPFFVAFRAQSSYPKVVEPFFSF